MTIESVLLAIRTNMLTGDARIDPRFRMLPQYPASCCRCLASCYRLLASGRWLQASENCCVPLVADYIDLTLGWMHIALVCIEPPSPLRLGAGPEYTEEEAREAFNRMMREHGWF